MEEAGEQHGLLGGRAKSSYDDASPLPGGDSNFSIDSEDMSPSDSGRRSGRGELWLALAIVTLVGSLGFLGFAVEDHQAALEARTTSLRVTTQTTTFSWLLTETSTHPLLVQTAAPVATPAPTPEADFGSVMKCVGEENQKLTFKSRLGICAKRSVQNGLGELGYLWSGYSKPNIYAEELSMKVARPLYSVPLSMACASMCQVSQCGPEEFVRNWTCPYCEKADFKITANTHRFIHYEELGHANATFIIVARIDGKIPNQVDFRPPQPLQNEGKRCWDFCGQAGGYCAWCGVGNACCGSNHKDDPLECKGITHPGPFHTCVAPNTDRAPGQLINQRKDCYEKCGKVSGYCNFCGSGNACCRNGVQDARECRGASGFTTVEHHECVTPSPDLEIPELTPNETGCVVIVRGSHNKQNGISNLEFLHTSLPFKQCKGCSVHAGFDTVWRNVHPKVVQALGSLGCFPGSDLSRVLLTGESFGGGVATLGQYYLQAAGYTMEIQYNYGSPRVGNVQWAEQYNKFFDREVPIFRVTHAHDVVSRLPPTRFLDYRHVSAEVFYAAEDPEEYVVCLGGEDFECQNRYDIAECLSFNVGVYDSEGSLKATPGEAFDADHCHSGLVPDLDMCQCTLSGWWKWYRSTDYIKHRWDSAPDNSAAPRLAPGAMVG